MAGAFGGLSPNHEDLIWTYLRFVRAKREIALKLMEGEFRDIKNDRLCEDMYSQEDVEDILDGLKGCVLTNLRQEVGAVANMTALLMKQMFEGAEEQGGVLTFDTGPVEDQALLEEVERMRVDGNLTSNNAQGPRLVSLKDQHTRLAEEMLKLRTTNENFQDSMTQLRRECAAAVRERNKEKAEVEALQRKLRFQADDKPPNASKSELDNQKHAEISALKEACERRLNDSPQFQQLKRLLACKSKQVVSLRRRLARYEPDDDDVKNDEDDEGAAL